MATDVQATGINRLLSGSRQLILPFELPLRAAQPLQVITSLRLLPGKRLSARAVWGDTPVMAKLFVREQRGDAYAQAEANGYQKVLAAQINTPGLLWQGESACGRLQVVLFEFLHTARSFADFIDGADHHEHLRCVDEMLALTAALHRVNAWQADPHLDNFLWQENQAWLVDVGSVVAANSLGRAQRLQNLALLLAQLPLDVRDAVPQWCQQYNALMSGNATMSDGAAIEPSELVPALAAAWRRRGDNVISKSLRECTATQVEQSWRRFVACRRDYLDAELAALLADPDVAMAQGRMLKDGNSATVVLVNCGSRALVIKRYNIKSRWHGLRRALRCSRAQNSWCYAHLLQFCGIATAAPVALIEQRFGPLRGRAWFVSEFTPATEMLDEFQRRTPTASELEQTRRIFSLLQRAWISHGDLKAQNLLIGEDGVVRLIDLDAMCWHTNESSWRKSFKRDLQRFLRNWQGQLRERFARLLEGFDHG